MLNTVPWDYLKKKRKIEENGRSFSGRRKSPASRGFPRSGNIPVNPEKSCQSCPLLSKGG
jgi:hypothetical protein